MALVVRSPYCVHQLFERQARVNSDKIAIDTPADDARLSYADLNRRANQYAHYLQASEIGPGALVGVFLQNSAERIAMLIAVHKVGAGYALLDPDHPSAYLSVILEGVSLALVVTETRFLAQLRIRKEPVVCLDTLTDVLMRQDSDDLVNTASPGDTAYVAFTSGSTGRPKAAVISHAASVNHIMSVAEAYALGCTDRLFLSASPGFDMTIEDIFPALSVGATIVLLPNLVLSSENISRLVEQQELTVLNLPGSLWHRWVGRLFETGAPIPPTLRLTVVGSEAIYTALLAKWKSLRGAERVAWIAAFGLTETAVTATLYRHAHHMPLPETKTVPIGRAIHNVEAWVLDEHLQECAPGVPGTLYVGGICLARGYLNDPEATARKFRFIRLPVRPTPTRLCDTGDRAVRLADGTLVWLGRSDEQLKWHGFRIEPAEIEQVLLQHPAVREAVVVAQQDQLVESHLVAFIVPSPAGPPPSSSILHAFLAQFLPAPRIPSRFIVCESLPLTPSGKINRLALSDASLQR